MSERSRFVLVVRGRSGVVHAEEVDCTPLVHDVAFSAVCRDRLPNDGRWEPVLVEPDWVDGRLEGVTVSVAGSSRTYSRAIFRDRAVEVLFAKGLLSEQGDDDVNVSWGLEVMTADVQKPSVRRRATIRRQAYPIVRRDVADLATARQDGPPGDWSLLVSTSLLAELRQESASSLERERADFLVGQLVRARDGHVAAVLRNRIPATTETVGSPVRFSFSPRTFQAAQRELEQRGDDQVILGWHHNHPPPCGHTCLMTIPACRTDNVAFSVDDRVVHRSAFGQPYMVALVSGKGADRRADDPLFRAYGWQRGLICEKPWSVF